MRSWLQLHVHAVAAALRHLASQPWTAALSVLVLALAISLPVIAASLLRGATAASSGLGADPHVNVYLALDASDEDAKRVGRQLRADAGAGAVRFIAKEEALAELKATTHLAELLESLERNPLPHAFTVAIPAADPQRLETLRAQWSRLPKVDQVVADFEWAERLARWMRFADRALLVLGLVLGAAVAFIVGHLIRLQVLARRAEIEVSQLVGATASDVRRPFLYHGALEGLLAGAGGVALAAAVGAWLAAEMQALAPSYATELTTILMPPEILLGIPLAAAVLGVAGAWIAVGRELRRYAANP